MTSDYMTGNAVTFINNTNKSIFLSFSDLMKRIGVVLPAQLRSSPHLMLQRDKKRQTASAAPVPAKKTRTH